jgi:hypothetical protein
MLDETKKKEEHVPRHIELTAVLRDLKTRRVIELKDLNHYSVKINRIKAI